MDKTTTRSTLSEAVFKNVGLSRNESANLVDSVFGEILKSLIDGDDVKISSFGTFVVRQKKERIGRNPKTGQEVPITARSVVTFRASNVLKSKVNSKNTILKIIEKPKKFISNLAVTGLYFFDNNVIRYSKNLKPSRRKEIEITDLLNIYRKKRQLNSEMLGRGGVWLDTGSIEDFYSASNFISTIENRQGFKIACIEEISLNNKWIKEKEIKNQISFYGNCEYSKYLKHLI